MASPFPAAGPGYPLQVLAASCFGGSGLSAAIPLAGGGGRVGFGNDKWDIEDTKGREGIAWHRAKPRAWLKNADS